MYLIQQTITQNSEIINLFPSGKEANGRVVFYFDNVLTTRNYKRLRFKDRTFKLVLFETEDSNITMCRFKEPDILQSVLCPKICYTFDQGYIIHKQSHEYHQRPRTPFLWRKAERIEDFQPEEEIGLGYLISAFSYVKRAYKKDGERLFTKACSVRTWNNSFKWKEGWFRLDIRKKNFYNEGGEVQE